MADYSHKIVIAGAGIAGLSAAVYLKEQGYRNITFIEASDRPGGRLKTDIIDGYTLNHGFHLFNTAYPCAQELLDYSKLDLKYFKSGAIIMRQGKLTRVSEALKMSFFAFKMLFSDIGNFKDKLKLIKKRIELKQMTEEEIFDKFEIKTSSLLKKKNFSKQIISHFFQPYFSSIFLEDELTTSRRMLDFNYKMITEGRLSIPAKGIEAIPNQLASYFDQSDFIFNTKVLDYSDGKVSLDNGTYVESDIFIIATEQTDLYHKMRKVPAKTDYRSATCLYFSADKKPFLDAMICVSANDPKLVNSVAVLTNISKLFAPKNMELICVSLNGLVRADDAIVEKEVKTELYRTFGSQVESWNLIKTYKIDYAIPNQDYVLAKRRILELRLDKNIYACGDHLLYGNINGAMRSGKQIAEIIHSDFNKDHKFEKKLKYSKLFDNKV